MGVMHKSRTVERSQTYARPASSAPQMINLYEDLQLAESIVVALQIIVRGTMTSTGGGAISGFHRDAPSGMIQNIVLDGQHVPSGKVRTIVNAPAQQLFWPGTFFSGVLNALLRTSTGAAATDPFRATFPLPLVDPRSRYSRSTYIDVRDYSDLKLGIKNWAADADLGTTNLSTVQSVDIEVIASVLEDGPPQGNPHYEPILSYKEYPMGTTSTQLVTDGQFVWEGLLTSVYFQQHDDSATGDSERTNGILRRLSLRQKGQTLIDNVQWETVWRKTFHLYAYTKDTAEQAGIAIKPVEPVADAADGPGTFLRDTSSTAPTGITAVTAAAGDAAFVLGFAVEPVHGAPKRTR